MHPRKKVKANTGTDPFGALVGQNPGWMELVKEEGEIGFACLAHQRQRIGMVRRLRHGPR